ncbi:MAG: hypothetical protein U1D65_00095 [Pseudomonas sp.]|nr:hypothetical protein [Pseudomonas sp.]MDZ4190396.1 hypothetical protein [Pseudomonas sp.]
MSKPKLKKITRKAIADQLRKFADSVESGQVYVMEISTGTGEPISSNFGYMPSLDRFLNVSYRAG